MSEAARSAAPHGEADIPPFRYTARLAGEIEARWQDYWQEHGTFHAPNPTGPLHDPDHPRASAPKRYVMDMFPYPSGAGLHVGHPLGYIATDSYTRYLRMAGTTCCTRWASTPSACPPSSTRCRPAPIRGRPPRRTSTGTGASCVGWAWPTTSGGVRHHRRRLLPLDPVDLPADLQRLVRREAAQGPTDRRVDRRVRGRHPADSGRASVV